MSAADFAPLAEALASDHTVVTADPRGIANSSLDDPQQDSTPDLRADDVAAILDDLGAQSPPTIAHSTRFLAHELRGTASYRPDIAAFTRGPARVVVGIGAASGGLLTYRTSVALADQL